jgi:hypothetical protein
MVIDGTIRWNLNTRPPYQETAIHEQLSCWTRLIHNLSIGDATVPLPAWMMPVLGKLGNGFTT